MTGGRYVQAVRAALTALAADGPGVGVFVCPPGEHAAVVQAVAAVDPRWRPIPFADLRAAGPGDWLVAAGLPGDAQDQLRPYNSRREWLSRRGVRVLLVLDGREHRAFDRHAPDTASVALFTTELAFEPDDTVDRDRATADLQVWNRGRWGRLDLRGLIRAEGEDAAWPVDAVYQELRWTPDVREARDWFGNVDLSLGDLASGFVSLSLAQKAPRTSGLMLLGPPGSGKTFFLRWLATHVPERPKGLFRPAMLLAPLSALGAPTSGEALLAALESWLLEGGQAFGHLLRSEAEAGRVSFLLDGLDEVGAVESRRRLIEAVDALDGRFPGCPVVVTTRLAGYADAPSRSLMPIRLEGLSTRSIRSFLVAWKTQYAVDRRGPGIEATREGEEQGARLADEVLGNTHLRSLAQSPLMLTILAVVHRAGVQLPNHRAELYHHASRVLIERWNLVRSLAPSSAVRPPLRAADAVRILGPVSLDVVRGGGRAAVSEGRLRAAIEGALRDGKLRGVGTVEDVLQVFQGSLGLLVEVAPGAWSFLHLTLAEYFAALELIRTGALETLAADPVGAFLAEWREVLVLAAGELGVNRAEDERVDALVHTLVRSARRRPGRPSSVVPSVLGGLLADDPNLAPSAASALIRTLVPTWWFERAYGAEGVRAVLAEAAALIGGQIDAGEHGPAFRAAVQRAYGKGSVARLVRALGTGSVASAVQLTRALLLSGVDPGRIVEAALLDAKAKAKVRAARWISGAWRRAEGDGVILELRVSRYLDEAVRSGRRAFDLSIRFPPRQGLVVLRPNVRTTAWSTWSRVGPEDEATVTLRHEIAGLPAELGAAGPLTARVRPSSRRGSRGA